MTADIVPVLTTARLRLRAHRPDDFEAMCALWADPFVTRHTTGHPLTPERAWARLLRHLGQWSALGFGFWVVEDRTEGRFVGKVGFGDVRRSLVPALPDMPEAGWILSREASGRGLATEAMRAALDWLDARAAHPRSFCIFDPAHGASLRVAEKLGYGDPVDGRHDGAPARILFRDRPARPKDHRAQGTALRRIVGHALGRT